jgi:hypothetical protein
VRIKASKLRESIFRILDQVLAAGVPEKIERRGEILKVDCGKPPSRLQRIQPRDYLRGDPEDLVHLDWFDAWRSGPTSTPLSPPGE